MSLEILTLSGSDIVVRVIMLPNAVDPILRTEFGITTFESFESAKAPAPILCTESGIFTEVSGTPINH